VLAVAWLAVVLAVAAAAGRKVLRLVAPPPAALGEGVLQSLGLGLGLFAYLLLAAGLAGALTRPVILALVALVALASWRETGNLARAALPLLRHRGRVSAWVWWLGGVVLVSAAANLVGALAPPANGDALVYHLAAPKLWLQTHRIEPLPWNWVTAGPLNVGMLFLLGLALSGDTLASLLNWVFGVLTAAGLVVVARRHFAGVTPGVAAALFYTSALVAATSTSMHVELGWTFFTLLAVSALLNYLADGNERGLAVCGIFAGLAAGTKVPAGLVPLVLLAALLSTHRLWRQPPRLRTLMRFVVPVVVLTLPWYLRSFLYSGDPFFPFLSALLGNERLREQLLSLSSPYGVGRGVGAAPPLPLRVLQAGGLEGLLNPLYLLFLPLALWAFRGAKQTFAVWFFLIGYALLWLLISDNARFLLPVLPLAALACASVVAAVERFGPLGKTVVRSVLLVGLTWGMLRAVWGAAPAFPVVAGLESRPAYLTRRVWIYEDVAWINARLPLDARVLVTNRETYYVERHVVGLSSRLAAELPQGLRRERITHILCVGPDCDRVRSSGIGVKILRERRERRSGSGRRAGGERASAVYEVVGP
jgi:hypothetical protein